jgi:PTS system nitrogen regulatory IIA component
MRFTDFLTEECIRPSLSAQSKSGVLQELAGVLAVGTGARAEVLHTLLTARERVASTAVGKGVAVPHCKLPGLSRIVACVGIHRQGVSFDTPGADPVHVFVGLVSPPHLVGMHVGVLSRTVALLRDERLRQALLQASSSSAVFALLAGAEEAYLVGRGRLLPGVAGPSLASAF